MTNVPFKLFTSPISANGRKVLALTYYLKLNADIKLINVYKGEGQDAEYLAVNSFGKIPTLQEKNFILWESNAILQYIVEAHADYQLYSRDPKIRADISRWLFWESAHWQPAVSLVLAAVVGHELVPEYVPAPTEVTNWHEKSFDECVNYLNSHLSKNNFLSNGQLTIADFSIAGMMTYFRFAGFPFEKFSHLKKWYEGIEVLEAWIKTEVTPWNLS